jgi:hypothetical protein
LLFVPDATDLLGPENHHFALRIGWKLLTHDSDPFKN